MKTEDVKQFSEQVTALWHAFGREPAKLTIRAWWDALQDLEIDTVERALRKAIRESDSMPFVSQVRRHAHGAQRRDKTPAEILRERQERQAEAERVWGSWDVPEVGAER